jgi:hypothetical protein
MSGAQDPRLQELKRLQLALDAASKHLDEFEARALGRSPKARVSRTSATSDRTAENSLAGPIVAFQFDPGIHRSLPKSHPIAPLTENSFGFLIAPTQKRSFR